MRLPALLDRVPAVRLAGLAVLLAPAAALGLAAVRLGSPALAAGAVVGVVVAGLLLKHPAVWRPPTGGPLVLVYLLAAAWAWVNTRESDAPVAAAVRGALLLGAAGLLAAHDLHRTGAEPRRRTKALCVRLQSRRWWPNTPAEVRTLPEVRALRDAAGVEPGPVFGLFHDPRPEIRTAAFAALEGRSGWRLREAAALLVAAERTAEPEVRAAAVAALGAVDEPVAVAGLTGFFRDPSPAVRRGAVRAALRGGGQKWAFVRDGVRLALSDPKTAADGVLPGAAGYLPVVAVCDLTTWAGEPEPLGTRATRTLAEHYAILFQTGAAGVELITELTHQVTDPGTPTGLRVEVATLLRNAGHLTHDLLDLMTNADQPGPIRLLAAEALLTANPHDPDGLDVLRGLARQPNREMALSIAHVLQTKLGIDMGLPASTPAANSKPAGDVARRVLAWAANKLPHAPPAAPGLPPRPALSGGPPIGPPAAQGRPNAGKKPW